MDKEMLLTTEEQLKNLHREDGISKVSPNAGLGSVRSLLCRDMHCPDGPCNTCIGHTPLKLLWEIEPNLTKHNLLETIKILHLLK